MQPTIGRIVLYTLTETEAAAINKRREDFKAFAREHVTVPAPGELGASGHQAHFGNSASAGQQYPALVVRVFNETSPTVNLKVELDGSDTYWATSATPGDGEGHWVWPPRA